MNQFHYKHKHMYYINRIKRGMTVLFSLHRNNITSKVVLIHNTYHHTHDKKMLLPRKILLLTFSTPI